MPRTARVAPGGMVFHVLNRGVGRRRIFDKDADYAAFEAIVEETLAKCPMRICAYCWMPNHWHFVLWPEADDHLAAFMQRLSVTHVTRWQKHRRVVGEGHVYQGRFKSFPIETEDYFYQVLRYVERNALRTSRGMALGQSLASCAWFGRRTFVVERLALASSSTMGCARESCTNRWRSERDPPQRSSGPTFRLAELG